MNRVQVDRERCKACGLCIDACNRKLLALGPELNDRGYHPVHIHDEELCSACTLCGVVCPEAGVQVFKDPDYKTPKFTAKEAS